MRQLLEYTLSFLGEKCVLAVLSPDVLMVHEYGEIGHPLS